MTVGRMLGLALAAQLAVFAVLSCGSLAPTLNPDPVHGGDCHDGDQLGELCSDRVTCCHPSAGERCGLQPRQCVPVDPGPPLDLPQRRRDAGARP